MLPTISSSVYVVWKSSHFILKEVHFGGGFKSVLDVKRSAVTGPVHASAAASSGASAASSSAVSAEQIVRRQRGENKWGGEIRGSLCNVPQCVGYVKPTAVHYSGLIRIAGLFFLFFLLTLTSSSFSLMSFSVSASGVDSGRRGMGLSTRLSAFILLREKQ